MTRVTLVVCNRCGRTEKEDDFQGKDVTIFDEDGTGKEEDQFSLCDPCVDALRKWIVTRPSGAQP